MSCGWIGPTVSWTDVAPLPSSVTVWASSVWLEIVMTNGPAPSLAGETVTPRSWMTPVSSMGTAGRLSFSKSSPPHPAKSSAVPKNSGGQMRIFRSALIPRPPP